MNSDLSAAELETMLKCVQSIYLHTYSKKHRPDWVRLVQAMWMLADLEPKLKETTAPGPGRRGRKEAVNQSIRIKSNQIKSVQFREKELKGNWFRLVYETGNASLGL
ncbi:uncharacterized protein BO96DRAFT_404723 [Aspergillus niger CBS 101883]|uniref:Uncharacterized protein n=2 Tax=Aspergillus niger TaxID=5061 RepID=A2RAU7_ASPNC|nr:uncharacterized protein BO96DRAFT_404723 [Aspergillus niger CBS 101883]XP_059602929.1 hypothetical protein An18g04390 [Aspergillus niger]PYH51152.1 hypothetical protein BO96DRAFT_404723 [Aspergillus niger CBS 101883]CAK43243.1 hypothetical protein An18g04390 [Aspergillus niger]